MSIDGTERHHSSLTDSVETALKQLSNTASHIKARNDMRASEVVHEPLDITTHVGIQREMREDQEMKLPPHDRVKQVAWLLKRMTWLQLEDQVAKPMGIPASTLINWAQEVDK